MYKCVKVIYKLANWPLNDMMECNMFIIHIYVIVLLKLIESLYTFRADCVFVYRVK